MFGGRRSGSARLIPPVLALVFIFLLSSVASAAGRNDAFGFNGSASGFPTGAVRLTGGGAYNPASGFVHAAGGFRCTAAVLQGPLGVSVNPSDPGPCLAGQGVRWDTAALLPSTTFKCVPAEPAATPATTDAHTVVLQADFYRAGDGNNESLHAQMIVSDHDLPGHAGVNLWVQGVGCGKAIAHFSGR